jgi:hypothetical protein
LIELLVFQPQEFNCTLFDAYKIEEKTRKRKIEANIIEQLVSMYESIKKSFEENKGESSEYYVRIYGKVIDDLREIVEFESKKYNN